MSEPGVAYYPNRELYTPTPSSEAALMDNPLTADGFHSGNFDIDRARIGTAKLYGTLELMAARSPGAIFYEKTGYDTGEGIWIGPDGVGLGVPAGSHYLTYDFTTIRFKGAIEGGTMTGVDITGGTIAGFTIAATQLSVTGMVLSSSGKSISLGTADDIVILDADDATYRLWAGAAAAASAPFSVDKDGGLIASDTRLLKAGSGDAILTIDYDDATYRLWIGDATAADALFRVTSGGLVEHEVASSLTTFERMRDGSSAAYVEAQASSSATLGQERRRAYGTSTREAYILLAGGNSDGATLADLVALKSGGSVGGAYEVQADGDHEWYVDTTTLGMSLARTNRALSLNGRFYPGLQGGGAAQSTSYITYVATAIIHLEADQLEIQGNSSDPVFIIANHKNATSATTGGSGAPPAQVQGYLNVMLGGNERLIPYYNP